MIAILLNDMSSDRCRQLIDKQWTCLLRVLKGRDKRPSEICKNSIRLRRDRLQCRYCRQTGFLGDRFE